MGDNILLGKYELLERIGVGGMAEVFKARLLSPHGLSRTVALKQVLPYHCADEEFVRMFLDEARIALSLTHPNIGQIYELGQVNNSYFLVMEYIDGPNLADVVKALRKTGHRFPLGEALYTVAKVCAGLHAAHIQRDEQGRPMQIIHRDVSPHNVMVGTIGGVKLIDFGIAKARDRLVQTRTGSVRGKLLYMSPEQASSKPLNPCSDLFSAAMLLVTLLNGEHVWRGANEVEVLLGLRDWEPVNIAELRPDLHPEALQNLQAFLDKAMAYQPEDRFADGEAMRAALARLIAQSDPEVSAIRLGSFVQEVMQGDLTRASLPRAEDATSLQRFSGEQGKLGDTSQLAPGEVSRILEAAEDRADTLAHAISEVNTALHDVPQAMHGLPVEREQTNLLHLSDVEVFGDDALPSSGETLATSTDVRSIDVRSIDVRSTSDDGDPTTERGALPDLGPMEVGGTVKSTILPHPMPPPAEAPSSGGKSGRWGIVAAFGAVLAIFLIGTVGVAAWRLLGHEEPPRVATETALMVDSDPSGAAVFLDGVSLNQTTPARVAGVDPGEHTLTLEAEGKEVFRERFTLLEGKTLSFHSDHGKATTPTPAGALANKAARIAAEADAGSGEQVAEPESTLSIRSNVAARVSIDGEELPDQVSPKHPMEVTLLQKNQTYKIKVARLGYESFERPILIDSEFIEINATLKPLYGYLTVNSEPWAEVFIDGKSAIRATPLRKHRLKPGSYKIRLHNPARGLSRSFSVEIKPGKHITRTINLTGGG